MNANSTPRKFLCSINAGGEYLFYPLSATTIEQVNFLDVDNLKLENALAERIAVNQYPMPERDWPLRYIFHTAFCGSTLLCRALGETPRVMVLKEPDVLMKISSQSLLAGNQAVVPYMLASLKTLSQPWTDNGVVIIKPTNSVNRLLLDVTVNYPGKTILLYGGLEDFMISCLKKLPAAEQKIRWMAQHLIHGTELQKKLGVDTYYPFNFLEACIITWYSQMEYFAKAIAQDERDQIRTLNMKKMLSDPLAAVRAASEFFRLDRSGTEIEASVDREFRRNSKHLEKTYTESDRTSEAAKIRAEYSALLEVAMKWAEDNIAPIALLPAHHKPLF